VGTDPAGKKCHVHPTEKCENQRSTARSMPINFKFSPRSDICQMDAIPPKHVRDCATDSSCEFAFQFDFIYHKV
jgi:hypothetical protein